MSFANAVFSAVFVPSPPEPKLIPFCFLSGFPVGAWLLYALPSITYTGWRVIPFCPIWGDFRNHLLKFSGIFLLLCRIYTRREYGPIQRYIELPYHTLCMEFHAIYPAPVAGNLGKGPELGSSQYDSG